MIFGITYVILIRTQEINLQELITEQDNSQKVVNNNEGEITNGKNLPEGFPKDFPVYENSLLVNSWKAPGNTTEGYSVIWESPDSRDIVVTFFKESLVLKDWEILSEKEESDSQIISFQKSSKKGFIGIVKGEGAKTIISVTIGVGEE